MGRRDDKRAATRAALLEAAFEVFLETGYHATTIDEIAARAGLTKGAVYYNFPTKRAVLLAALRSALDAPVPDVAPPALTSLEETVRHLSAAYTSRLDGSPGQARYAALLFELISLIVRDADDMAAYGQARRLNTLLVARALERVATATGEGADRRLDGVAGSVLMALSGATIARLFDAQLWTPDMVADACRRLADMPDALPRRLAEVGQVKAPSLSPTALSALSPAPDLVTGASVALSEFSGVLAVLPMPTLDDFDLVLHSVRAESPTIPLGVLVTVAQGKEDLAELLAWNVADITAFIRGTLPPQCLPDVAFFVDNDGMVAAHLDLDRADGHIRALGLDGGTIVGEGFGPDGARAVARALVAGTVPGNYDHAERPPHGREELHRLRPVQADLRKVAAALQVAPAAADSGT